MLTMNQYINEHRVIEYKYFQKLIIIFFLYTKQYTFKGEHYFCIIGFNIFLYSLITKINKYSPIISMNRIKL